MILNDEEQKIDTATTELTNEDNISEEINIKTKFHKKLINLLQKCNQTFETANIWMLNQLIIPLTAGTAQNSNQLKQRYLTPENDYIIYNSSINNTGTALVEPLTNGLMNESIHNVSIDESLAKKSTISKLHIHTCYAFSQTGTFSLPLVVFPRNELDSNCTEALKKTTVIDETTSGDINEDIFYKWLKRFLQTIEGIRQQQPLILMCNSTIPINSSETIKFCVENNVYMLFYPLDDQLEIFNKSIFFRFKDAWKLVLQQYSMKDNPNSQLSFLFVYKQVLRKILSVESIKECFREFLKIYRLPSQLHQQEEENFLSIERQSSTTSDFSDLNFISDDCNPTATSVTNNNNNNNNNNVDENNLDENNMQTTQVVSNYNNNIKFSEQELNEYCEWIKFMSSIGCLCVKYTFLRDLSLKYRLTINRSSKEVLASEKKWLELIKKNKIKFNDCNENSYCFNEDDYLSKWFDTDIWRCLYYKLLKDKTITNPSSIWTFDIIQFPCVVTNNNLLRAPERDLNRPRNIKPRISVLFAFNAAGDYIQPFIVYPLNFQVEGATNPDEDDEIASNECYAQNGYINCKIFNIWLTKIFLPYIQQQSPLCDDAQQQQEYLLLYCGKLAIIDHANMNICNESRVNLFCLTHDSMQPFNCLFQKNLRKRQTDLFLDSWRKITAKQNLSYQFKCKSKLEFRNLFMDTFQNCIEEIGDFKVKLMNTFEICQLWPINEDEYKLFLINGELALNKKQKITYTTIALTPTVYSETIIKTEEISINSNSIVKQNGIIKKTQVVASSPVKIKQPEIITNNKRQKNKIELNNNNNNKRGRGKRQTSKTVVRRANKANSCTDDEDDDVEDDEDDNEESEYGVDSDDTYEDVDSDVDENENGELYSFNDIEEYLNGNNSSEDEFVPTSKKRRRVSESPAVLINRQYHLQSQLNKKIKLQQQVIEPKRVEKTVPKIGKQNNYSLEDLLTKDSSLVANIKNLISIELMKYFEDTRPTENEEHYKKNATEEEACFVNNIDFKILTNELLLSSKISKLTDIFNLSVYDLGDLYKMNSNEPFKFLKKLCTLFNKKLSSDIDRCFSFIKNLMSRLFAVNFEENWPKFIQIIDESLF